MAVQRIKPARDAVVGSDLNLDQYDTLAAADLSHCHALSTVKSAPAKSSPGLDKGLFGNILNKIFHHYSVEAATPASSPGLVLPSAPAVAVAAPGALPAATVNATAALPAGGDVGAVLAAMKDDHGVNYQSSIVDLLKPLDFIPASRQAVSWPRSSAFMRASVVTTVQRRSIGRISVLIVDKDHRRQGIATQLLGVAEAAIAKQGCALIEAMSDIDLENSHNFFRTANYEQENYRVAR